MASFFRKMGRYAFGKLMPKAAYPVLTGPLKGARFILGGLAGEGGGASVYFGGIESEQTAAMARSLRNGDVFFDIGANAGYYSILASRLVGKSGAVVAVEPFVRNLAFLQRHIEINRAANVRVLAFACSAENSIASFITGDNNALGHLSRESQTNEKVGPIVPTITLSELCRRTGLAPNSIKIDVEGAEMEVLKGGEEILNRHRPMIFLSTHSEQLRADCLAYLHGLGYVSRPLVAGDDPHEFILEPA